MSGVDLDAVAATHGPGLIGALLIGVSAAKALSLAWGVPYVGVNHMEGHLFATFLERPDLEPPLVVLLVSGGHTMIVHLKERGRYRILGSTIDDAAGETPTTEESYGGSFGGRDSDAPSPRSSNSHSTSGSNSGSSSSSSTSSSNSSGSSSSGSDGSDIGSRGGGAAGDCVAELPKGEARRPQSWNHPVIFPSRTRGGNQNRGE